MRATIAPEPGSPRGRVLIVDDSAVARAVLARVLTQSRRLELAGSVSNAAAAMSFLASEPVDIVVLDVHMPGVDGLTALPDLIAASRGAKILIVSTVAADGAASTIQALALGAADTLVKPGPGEPSRRFDAELIAKLERLLDPQVRDTMAADSAPGGGHVVRPIADSFDVVAIGASTGGIHALSGLLRELPASFMPPILVTQHLPPSFMPYFATQLAVLAGRPCEVATDHLRIRPGRIVVAPGEAHLRCVPIGQGGAAVRLSTEHAPSGCMPSVDPMFESVAGCFGPRSLAVVLSGMGRDGTEGARRIAEVGGAVVAQDEASSAVWGMPGSVAAAIPSVALLEPREIGRLMASRKRPPC